MVDIALIEARTALIPWTEISRAMGFPVLDLDFEGGDVMFAAPMDDVYAEALAAHVDEMVADVLAAPMDVNVDGLEWAEEGMDSTY